MSKTMAEVLAEHRMSPLDYAYCICGAELSPEEGGGWTTHEVMEAHQAAALSAAGFGLVADAKAKFGAVTALIQGWEQKPGLSIRQSQMIIALKEAIEGNPE